MWLRYTICSEWLGCAACCVAVFLKANVEPLKSAKALLRETAKFMAAIATECTISRDKASDQLAPNLRAVDEHMRAQAPSLAAAGSNAAAQTAAAVQRARARPKQIIEASLQGLILQPHCLRLLSQLREAYIADELRLVALREALQGRPQVQSQACSAIHDAALHW